MQDVRCKLTACTQQGMANLVVGVSKNLATLKTVLYGAARSQLSSYLVHGVLPLLYHDSNIMYSCMHEGQLIGKVQLARGK